MAETELHFFQVKIEVFATHSAVTLDLGIAPEVLNRIDVLTLARLEALLD
jgi:hypothetical protein